MGGLTLLFFWKFLSSDRGSEMARQKNDVVVVGDVAVVDDDYDDDDVSLAEGSAVWQLFYSFSMLRRIFCSLGTATVNNLCSTLGVPDTLLRGAKSLVL